MLTLRYTLLSDGSSDIALMPIIEWLIAQHRPGLGVLGQLAEGMSSADLALASRVPQALRLFPCDVLFIHRDAEGDSIDARMREIEGVGLPPIQHVVPIIPVRMTEAWLLSDETVIREAAENRAGRNDLNLPPKRAWENCSDPKKILLEALICASGKSGRALARFKPQQHRHKVAQRTPNFARLRGLPSFDIFEAKLIKKLKDI